MTMSVLTVGIYLKRNSKAKIDELSFFNRLNKEKSKGMGIDYFLVSKWRFFIKGKFMSIISLQRQ